MTSWSSFWSVGISTHVVRPVDDLSFDVGLLGWNVARISRHVLMFRRCIRPWRWRQYVPQKRWYPSTSLHGVTTWKTNINIYTAMRTLNLIFWVVAPCCILAVYLRFRGTYCLRHKRTVIQFIVQGSLVCSWSLQGIGYNLKVGM
jgi:threonine/homoserine efflux transporter RhtA